MADGDRSDRAERRRADHGWTDRAWRLPPNRVSRFYRGGLLLDRFRGRANAADTVEPEDWIGSATRAWTPPGVPPTDEGLGVAERDGETRRVIDLVAADPVGVGGPDLAALATSPFGASTGILLKLLDAGNRLPVHAHPTRSFARERLGSPFGKAEAWIVLATRAIDREPPPNVRLGFRRDVARDELRGWLDGERSDALLEAMEERPTAAGDVWFVPPGVPHAIGAGVFILEVQEPTDFSIVLETRDFPIDREDAHLRLGWDRAIEAIDRTAYRAERVAALRSTIDLGLPPAADPFFWAREIVVHDRASLDVPARFVVAAVLAGAGVVRTPGGELPVGAGDTFAVPAAAVASTEIVASEPLRIVVAGSAGAPAPTG